MSHIEISTVAELDALPEGALVTDRDGDRWHKLPGGKWGIVGRSGSNPSKDLVRLWAPLTLVWQPDVHMTKCVGDGCQSSHALPPGSSWACPDHSKHLIPGGN